MLNSYIPLNEYALPPGGLNGEVYLAAEVYFCS
jgi:hypothetical protein